MSVFVFVRVRVGNFVCPCDYLVVFVRVRVYVFVCVFVWLFVSVCLFL